MALADALDFLSPKSIKRSSAPRAAVRTVSSLLIYTLYGRPLPALSRPPPPGQLLSAASSRFQVLASSMTRHGGMVFFQSDSYAHGLAAVLARPCFISHGVSPRHFGIGARSINSEAGVSRFSFYLGSFFRVALIQAFRRFRLKARRQGLPPRRISQR